MTRSSRQRSRGCRITFWNRGALRALYGHAARGRSGRPGSRHPAGHPLPGSRSTEIKARLLADDRSLGRRADPDPLGRGREALIVDVPLVAAPRRGRHGRWRCWRPAGTSPPRASGRGSGSKYSEYRYQQRVPRHGGVVLGAGLQRAWARMLAQTCRPSRHDRPARLRRRAPRGSSAEMIAGQRRWSTSTTSRVAAVRRLARSSCWARSSRFWPRASRVTSSPSSVVAASRVSRSFEAEAQAAARPRASEFDALFTCCYPKRDRGQARHGAGRGRSTSATGCAAQDALQRVRGGPGPRRPGLDPGRADRLDRPRGQPAPGRHRHQRRGRVALAEPRRA
jgi:hypothetical protein